MEIIVKNIVYLCVLTIYYLIINILKIDVKLNKLGLLLSTVLFECGIIWFGVSGGRAYLILPLVGFVGCIGAIDGGTKLKFRSALIITIIYLLFGEMANSFFLMVDGYFWGNKESSIYEDCKYVQDYLFVIILLLFIYFFTIKKGNVNEKVGMTTKVGIYGSLILLEISLMANITYTGRLISAIKEENIKNVYYVVSILSFISLAIIIFVFIYIINVNKKVNLSYEQEKIIKETQEVFYKTLLDKEEETRKFRHDITGHIICMRNLLQEKNTHSALQYLDEMNQSINLITKYIYISGNKQVDVLTNFYLGQLNENINVDIKGRLSENIKISQYDLCIIYSNMLKNAVEEMEESKEGYVKISFTMGKQYTRIQVENSLNKDRKELEKWDKNEAKNHGYGIANIKETIEKYGGNVEFTKGNDVYMIVVTF